MSAGYFVCGRHDITISTTTRTTPRGFGAQSCWACEQEAATARIERRLRDIQELLETRATPTPDEIRRLADLDAMVARNALIGGGLA